MESRDAITALSALAHAGRLAVFRLLMRRAPQAVRPTEIAEALGLRQNTLSVHLATLTRAGLLTAERRGRAIFYRLDRARIAGLIAYLAEDCCRGRPDVCLPVRRSGTTPRPGPGDGGPFRILFVCTVNAARSLIAESIVNADSSGRFRAWSAGMQSRDEADPRAIALLRSRGHDVSALRPKTLDEVLGPDAPDFDFVFTLCDRAANAECPAWPGNPVCAHWGMPDPAEATGSEAEALAAFRGAFLTLERRIKALLALPVASLDRVALQREVDAIAEMAVEGVEAS
jgi:protein-tyrosine-phosphatase/DNA-binding transcriptional ArsR family regulator